VPEMRSKYFKVSRKGTTKFYNQKINDLEELKKSVLQKAFSGALRCGEPAATKTAKQIAL